MLKMSNRSKNLMLKMSSKGADLMLKMSSNPPDLMLILSNRSQVRTYPDHVQAIQVHRRCARRDAQTTIRTKT